jgi:hypothetical protein
MIFKVVGNGLSSSGGGIFGINDYGFILSFFFFILGQRYKSKHLSNL